MPLQNRVTPFGEIIRSPARGAWLGNRGLLHDEHQQIQREYAVQRWIICVLDFKDRQRQVMSPGLYTELFFLDEATALAAGHRPCAECRRADFDRFKDAWAAAHGGQAKTLRVAEIDGMLHAQRLTAQRTKQTFSARIGSLPDGVMVVKDDSAYLKFAHQLHLWHPAGYQTPLNFRPDESVTVLTPPATVQTIAAGYTVAR